MVKQPACSGRSIRWGVGLQASGLACRALQCPMHPCLLQCLPAYYTTSHHTGRAWCPPVVATPTMPGRAPLVFVMPSSTEA